MSTLTHSASRAGQSIFGAVAESANAVGSLFTAASGGAAMLNRYVDTARIKQDKRCAIDLETYEHRLLVNSSDENTALSLEIEKKCGDNPRYAELFNAEYARLQRILNPNVETPSA